MSLNLDLGGQSIICEDVKVGATAPGQAGTSLSSTELSLIDGASAGAIVASKVAVANSSGQLPVKRIVIDDALNVAPTANQSGALIHVNKTDGVTITLPAPSVGLNYDIVVTASTASGNTKIITDAGTTFLVGTVLMFDTDTLTDPLSVATANGSTHVACTMSGTTTGGLLGTRLRFTCVSATLWTVEGIIHHSGIVATPFATS